MAKSRGEVVRTLLYSMPVCGACSGSHCACAVATMESGVEAGSAVPGAGDSASAMPGSNGAVGGSNGTKPAPAGASVSTRTDSAAGAADTGATATDVTMTGPVRAENGSSNGIASTAAAPAAEAPPSGGSEAATSATPSNDAPAPGKSTVRPRLSGPSRPGMRVARLGRGGKRRRGILGLAGLLAGASEQPARKVPRSLGARSKAPFVVAKSSGGPPRQGAGVKRAIVVRPSVGPRPVADSRRPSRLPGLGRIVSDRVVPRVLTPAGKGRRQSPSIAGAKAAGNADSAVETANGQKRYGRKRLKRSGHVDAGEGTWAGVWKAHLRKRAINRGLDYIFRVCRTTASCSWPCPPHFHAPDARCRVRANVVAVTDVCVRGELQHVRQ